MKLFIVAIVVFNIGFVQADNLIPTAPSWAIPARGISLDANQNLEQKNTLVGSTKTYTQVEIDNKFSAPDWFESDHVPMPDIVRYGKKPGVWACASCHLASGLGHPESSTLAGLTATYIEKQLDDFSTGSRLDYSGHMNRMAALMTTAEKKDAAHWFASLKPRKFLDVIETDFVPSTLIDDTRMRLEINKGELEPLAGRIIEVPEKIAQVKLRAPYGKFISYVPAGSIARGQNIVMTGGGKGAPCIVCHGADLKGSSIAPSLAGKFAIYTVRQLHGFKSGTRKSPQMAPMAAGLGDQDIVDVAAFLGSLSPG